MKTCIWPPIEESLFSGRKADVVELLDEVAERTTRTSRPWTKRLAEGEEVPAGSVAKREYSDTSEHVHINPPNKTRAHRVSKKVFAKDETAHDWLLQKYEPMLRAGEWRIVFVDGRPLYRIWTRAAWDNGDAPHGAWITHACCDVPGIYTLQELRQVNY